MPEITVFHRRYLQNLKSNTTKSDTLRYVFFKHRNCPACAAFAFIEKGCKFFYKNAIICNCNGLISQTCFNITPITDFTSTLPQNF